VTGEVPQLGTRHGHDTAQQGAKGRAVPSLLSFCRVSRMVRPLAGMAAIHYLRITQVFSVTNRREPIFNVPPAVIATVIVLVLVHAVRALVLTDEQDAQFLLTFAFIPARYDAAGLIDGSLPGGFGAELWTFFTYAFIHADLLHIGVNLAWLVPFGTALARRFGAWRYTGFMLVTAAAGALAHLISHPGAMVPMIGASAAISGAMAAAMRFVFQQGGPLSVFRSTNDNDAYRVPAASLFATLRDPRFLMFLVVWIGLNALIGLGSVSIGTEAGQEIAWQAHIGGFFAGLILFNAFDPVLPPRELDTEPSA
jgi:membrane associated rhomboid family serine protease